MLRNLWFAVVGILSIAVFVMTISQQVETPFYGSITMSAVITTIVVILWYGLQIGAMSFILLFANPLILALLWWSHQHGAQLNSGAWNTEMMRAGVMICMLLNGLLAFLMHDHHRKRNWPAS